jgi:hypothetical protein
LTADDALVRIDRRGGQTRLLEAVQGKPALLDDGSVAIARRGNEPGETDIWLSPPGVPARPVGAGPGPDDFPIALTDGRIAFVSGRSGIASLWIADPRANSVLQLTNRGLEPGRPLDGFVPPPLEVISVSAAHLIYDAGGGERWKVQLASGAGELIGGAQP